MHSQRRKISHGNPTVSIETDASLEGRGATSQGEKNRRRLSSIEQINHINYLELVGAYLALQTFKENFPSGSHVQMLMDNTTAVAYINNKGGGRNAQIE